MKQLLVFIAVIYLITSCESSKAKKYVCTQYSSECELKKDQILIMPINSDSAALDVFGKPIICDNNQWYIVSTKVGVPIPVRIPVCTRYVSVDAGCYYEYYPSPSLIVEKWAKKCRVDTVKLSFVKGISKAAVLVSGQNEIIAQGGLDGYIAAFVQP